MNDKNKTPNWETLRIDTNDGEPSVKIVTLCGEHLRFPYAELVLTRDYIALEWEWELQIMLAMSDSTVSRKIALDVNTAGWDVAQDVATETAKKWLSELSAMVAAALGTLDNKEGE